MTDVTIARKTLNEDPTLSLVIVKNGNILAVKRGRGIRPVKLLMEELGEKSEGASIADKVTGKAAAGLFTLMKIKSVYTRVISTGALDLLNQSGIPAQYSELVPYILNRHKLDLCPMEKRVMNISDPSEILKQVEDFLSSLET